MGVRSSQCVLGFRNLAKLGKACLYKSSEKQQRLVVQLLATLIQSRIPDALAPVTTEFRSSPGVCDIAETCTGHDLICPNGAVCRSPGRFNLWAGRHYGAADDLRLNAGGSTRANAHLNRFRWLAHRRRVARSRSQNPTTSTGLSVDTDPPLPSCPSPPYPQHLIPSSATMAQV